MTGSFTRAAQAGTNAFRFTGRLGGHTLKAGRYVIVATPAGGRAVTASARVVG